MSKITLLDCTLRDGGYVNDWKFGRDNIDKIVRKLVQANVDVIECGYLNSICENDGDHTLFGELSDLSCFDNISKNASQSYALMVNYGEFPVECLGEADENSPIIRVAFHKKDIDNVCMYFSELKKRGFRFFVQPMGALNYTDEEFLYLIKRVNELLPEAFYIVDSFGVMELKDFRRLLFLCDHNLKSDIIIGYHSHNNLQQAYSNSKYMVEQGLEHDIVIDASVFGMGRGAGNLNIELFAKYLNENFLKSYNIEPFLEIFDECLKPILLTSFWGYSLPFYLSSIHNCHPNYANYFAEKNTLSVRSMHELLSMIADEDKAVFSDEKGSFYYKKYQENYVDDQMVKEHIKEIIDKKEILILAPGKSLKDNIAEIEEFIKSKQPIVIGVNQVMMTYAYDYLFLANEKRILPEKPLNVGEYIVTSNIKEKLSDSLVVNYSSYLCNDTNFDDPTLMLINLLMSIGVRHINIAGFDGFSANARDNYFEEHLSLGSNISTKLKKNNDIKNHIYKLNKQIVLNFITESKYL